MGAFARKFKPFYERTRYDIFEFAKELGFTGKPGQKGGVSWQQADVMQAVQIATHGFPAPSHKTVTKRAVANLGKRYLATKSGQGPGKTLASTLVGGWRTWQAPGALTMVTAPTMDQCREVWLSQFRKILEGPDVNPIMREYIKPTKSRVIFNNNPDWAIKFVTAVRSENAQGRHDHNMTWIAEEASGIMRGLMTQIEGTLSNLEGEGMNGLFMTIGNPNTRSCYFFDCFNLDRERWWTYTMNAEESPAWIVSPERNALLAQKYGRDSDVYRVRVLGEFPASDPTAVVSSEDLEACTRTDVSTCMAMGLREFNGTMRPIQQIGLDFARYGGDENTIYVRFGNAIIHWEHHANMDPNDLVDRAVALCYELGWNPREVVWVPDAGGMGQGLMRRFYDMDLPVLEFHNGGSAAGAEYFDKITEANFTLADKCKKRQVHIPNDPRLIHQLSSRLYRVEDKKGRGKLRVESKEKYVERMRRESGNSDTARSPDRADGLAMAFYDAVQMEALVRRKAG